MTATQYIVPRLNIKTWAEEDRPREKMLNQGRKALSDAELLAILFGSGNRGETAVDLAKRVLHACNDNLNELASWSPSRLQEFHGIGEAKALTICAALELGRRKQSTDSQDKMKISNSQDSYRILLPLLSDLDIEYFYVLYLNRAHKVIEKKIVSQGGVMGTVADIRVILSRGVELLASGIVLAHNHPSGTLRPSDADIQLTNKIKKGATLLDIRLIDHIILAGSGYYSFADEGRL